MKRKDYNGWRNRATWTCSLWARKDEGMYQAMVEYAQRSKRPTWRGFIRDMGMEGERNGDGILWLSRLIDCAALTEMVRECK